MRSWLDVLGKRTGTGGGHNLRADDPVCIEAKRLVSQHRCEGKKTTPKEAKRECVKTILKRGRETGCTSGKITLFVSKNIADEVWSTIANLVTEGLGEIGRGAKGEERSDELIHHSAIINSLLLVASLFAPLIAGCYAKISPLKGVPETGRYGRLCLGVYNEHFDNLKEIKMIQDRLIEVMRDYDSEDYDVCGYKPDIYTCLGIYGRTQKEWGNIGANLYSRNDLEEGKGGMAAPYMFVYSSPDWEPDSSVASNSSSSPPPPVYPSDFPASPEILGYVLYASGTLLPFYTEEHYYAFAGADDPIPGCLFDQPSPFFSNTHYPPCPAAGSLRLSLSKTEGACCFVPYNYYHEDDDGKEHILTFEEHHKKALESQSKDVKARRWMCQLTTVTATKSTGGKAPRKTLASPPSASSIGRLWGVADIDAFEELVSSIPPPIGESGRVEYAYPDMGDVAFLEYSSSSSGCAVHHVEVPEARRTGNGGAPVGKALLCAFVLGFASGRGPLDPECSYARHLLEKCDEGQAARVIGVEIVKEKPKKRRKR